MNLINIYEKLDKIYDKNTNFLVFQKDYEFLLAVLLTPRSKDIVVQEIASELFDKYKTLESIADADFADICQILKPVGFFRQKSHYLIEASKFIIENGIPSDLHELLKIKGMGRKCANVILKNLFNKPAVIVDTHFMRVLNKIGIYEKNPYKLELLVSDMLEAKYHSGFSTLVNLLGREVCKPKPLCFMCPIFQECDFYKHNLKS